MLSTVDRVLGLFRSVLHQLVTRVRYRYRQPVGVGTRGIGHYWVGSPTCECVITVM
jgi:hypothetical protein